MKDAIVLSFFFNARGGDLEKSTMGLYRSLLLQILKKAPELVSTLDHCGSLGSEAVRRHGWQQELLKETFELAVDRLQNRRLHCFIDALDECPEDDVRDMISFFEELGARERSSEVRICFSSRHYPEISIKSGLQLVLESEQDHTEDISLYINSQLKVGATQQAEEIKAEVLRKSSGIFLWVALVVPMLNKEHDRGRIRALKRRLDEIPSGLHDLFLDILTRDCNNLDELLLCIQCVLFANRPLSPVELHAALLMACEEGSEHFDHGQMASEVLRKFILDSSKGLAEITKSKNPTVQFIHESVRDFLLKDGGMEKLPIGGKNVDGQGHDALKRICMLHLKVWNAANPQKYKSRHFYRKPPNYTPLAHIDRDQVSTGLPFLEYAVQNVLCHANKAEREGVPQVEFLQDFPLDTWKPLFNSFEKFQVNHYNNRVSLLYILSEHGAESLVWIHPQRKSHFLARDSGRYQYPLLAALFAGKNAAARALVGFDPSRRSKSSGDPDGVRKMRKEGYHPSRSLVGYLAEYGDTQVLRKILMDEYHQRRIPKDPLAVLSNATSEDVVEILCEFGH
jgi:hypothetical protein